MEQKDPKSKKLDILLLLVRFPYPLIGGDRVKPYYMIKHLAKHHNVTVITFNRKELPPEDHINSLKELGIDLIVLPYNPAKQFVMSMLKTPFKYPLEVTYFQDSRYKKTVEEVLSKKDFDLILSFMIRTAEYVKKKSHKKILIAEDSRILYHDRSYKNTSFIVQKLPRFWEYIKNLKYEPEIVKWFDTVTFVTENDIRKTREVNPDIRYRLLTNGTDIDVFKPSDNTERRDIIFAGKLDVWANILSLQNLIYKVFPAVKNELPGVKLKIIGAGEPSIIKNIDNPDIEVIGKVPHFKPYLQQAGAFVHPHFGGSGIQNKLLEAMSCGCPVVTAPPGNQGINGKHETHIMIGETNAEIAKHTVRLLKDNELSKKVSANARKLMVDTHSWETVYEQLDSIIREVIDE